jgi:hypothetical protein
MTFAVPLFLFAALAAIIPVVLHMINRQRAKDLPFSTLRFLRVAVQKTRRRRRIQDVLLMLLRMALLILIALGLSKPALTNLNSLLGGRNTAVAIILDNSASMGMVDHDRVRFETARGAAMQVLDHLGDGDQVALWLTCGPQQPDLGKLDRTQEKVRQMLNQANVSYERAELATRVNEAQKVLAKAEASNREIFVIGDMQKLSWEALKPSAKPDAKAQEEDESKLSDEDRKIRNIPVVMIDCDRAPKPNVAVTGVEVAAAVPVAGLPIKATADVFNTSTVAQQRHLELYVDSTKEGSSPVLSVPPGGNVKYEFTFTFKRGGLHRGEVRLLGEDGSKYDDRRFFTMEVNQGIPVAVVQQERHEISYLDDTYYVERAISPAKGSGWAITTTPLLASNLASEPLNNFTAIYCVNLKAPEPAVAERLRAYVAGGGNLVWICGENVYPEAYNRMNEQAQKQLLPAPLLDIRTPDRATGKDSWQVTFLDKKHRALTHLVEPDSLYKSVLVYKHARMDTKGSAAAWVLARLDDGEPLLVERKVEQGRVLMLGTSGHVGWTNFPLRPIFLPLFASLTFELAGAEQTRHTALAGQPIVLPFEKDIRPLAVEVQPPSGATNRVSTVDKDGKQRDEFRYPDTHDIGVYLLRFLQAVRPVQIAYSVNIDPEESKPEKLEREELQKRFGKIALVFAEDPDDLTNVFKLLREGKSLWGTFLTLVLIGLVCETLISNRLTPKTDEEELKNIAPGMRRLAKKGQTAA